MDQWYYTESGEQRGPVGEQEIKNLLSTNKIGTASLLWREGMQQWTPAGSVPEFHVSPYASPISADAPSEIDWSGYTPSGPQVRPWIRYWARTADFLSFTLASGFVLGMVAPEFIEAIPDTAFGLVLLLLYNFVEPVFFTIWGTTPFKALLLVRVRNNDGSRLGYPQALVRVFKIWLRGAGLGIPLVTLITHVLSYTRLKENGITSWDAEGGFIVSHREVAWWRWLVLIGLFVGFISLVVIGSQMQ